jgi:hypothetical protein
MIRYRRRCGPLRKLRADCAGVGLIDGKAAVPISGSMNGQPESAPQSEAGRFKVNSFYHRACHQVQAQQDPCCGPAPGVGQRFC